MRLKLFCQLIVLYVSSLSVMAIAATEKVSQTATVSHSNMALGKTLLGLIVVTALIYGLAWCVKKFSHGNFMQQNGMKIISAMPLGTREKAVLLEVENTKLLIGVSPGGISRLHVFDSPSAIEENVNTQVADDSKEASLSNSIHLPSSPNSARINPKQEFSSYLKEVIKFSTGR